MTVGVGHRVVKELTTLVMRSNKKLQVRSHVRFKAEHCERLESLRISRKELGNIRVLVSVVGGGGGGAEEERRAGLLDGGGGGGGTAELLVFLKMTGP